MKDVQKITIKRIERTEEMMELEELIYMLELCKEADDVLWKELMLNHLEIMDGLANAEGESIKNEIRRRLNHGYGI